MTNYAEANTDPADRPRRISPEMFDRSYTPDPPEPAVIDEDDPILDTEPCLICGHNPCDCDDQYDRWKDR